MASALVLLVGCRSAPEPAANGVGHSNWVGEEVLVRDELVVHVYSHTLRTRMGLYPVWTFVSDGLRAQQHPEVSITVRREPDETEGLYPRELLGLYGDLHKVAAAGARVGVGGRSILRHGLLGRDELRCILYTAYQPLAGVPVDHPALTALLVPCDEVAAADEFGVTRVMARIGRATSFYPTAPWAERRAGQRASVAGNDGSILQRLSRAHMYHAFVHREASGRVVWSILPAAAPEVAQLLASPPARGDQPFAALLAVDPTADACLVWEPGQMRAQAISPGAARGERISGNFLVLVPGAERDEVRQTEDGFGLFMTAPTWARVRQALETHAPLQLGDMFALEWPPASYADPVGAQTFIIEKRWAPGNPFSAGNPRAEPGPGR